MGDKSKAFKFWINPNDADMTSIAAVRLMQLQERGWKTNSHYPGTIGPGLYSEDVYALGICSRYRRIEKKQEEPWNVLSVENMGTIALFFNILFPPPHL